MLIPPNADASMTIDLQIKPLKKGNPEMDAAPMMQKIHVKGILL
jgi:hypothetical protein